MDVGLNSGQLALRDSVRDVLRTECPPGVARQAMTDPERWRTVWKTVVDLGWTELAAPGSGDYGPVELAVVLEECGAALAPIPLLSSVGLAAGALRTSGLDSVLTAVERFYSEVVQPIKPWSAAPPKVREPETAPLDEPLARGQIPVQATGAPESFGLSTAQPA